MGTDDERARLAMTTDARVTEDLQADEPCGHQSTDTGGVFR
jgi:hypothetical protein